MDIFFVFNSRYCRPSHFRLWLHYWRAQMWLDVWMSIKDTVGLGQTS